MGLASRGLRETDNGIEKAADDEVEASRRVARGIYRDAMLIGLGAALLAVATSFVR